MLELDQAAPGHSISFAAPMPEVPDAFGAVRRQPGTLALFAAQDGPAARPEPDYAPVIAELDSCRVIGGFRLRELIGHGPGSIAYRGEHDCDGPRIEVALRVSRRRLAQAGDRAVFRCACQVLASLRHTSLACFVQGGLTEEQVPYLVTELVSGLPITRYAVEVQLDIPARVRLLLRACHAVASAHRRGVSHGRLTADDLRVDHTGQLKVCNLGVRSLFESEFGPEAASDRDSASEPVGIAPEQRRGERGTAAADIFALGVILHQLLFGAMPRQLPLRAYEPCDLDDATDLWLLAAPQANLLTALRAGLDDVLVKAMAPAPAQRHRDAAELARELERFLDTPTGVHSCLG